MSTGAPCICSHAYIIAVHIVIAQSADRLLPLRLPVLICMRTGVTNAFLTIRN